MPVNTLNVYEHFHVPAAEAPRSRAQASAIHHRSGVSIVTRLLTGLAALAFGVFALLLDR